MFIERSSNFSISFFPYLLLQTNSNDENGVVVGRWKEPYRPYVNPWSWMGSGDIIMKYYREGGNPVKVH